MTLDETRYRVRKLSANSFTLVGGGEVVGLGREGIVAVGQLEGVHEALAVEPQVAGKAHFQIGAGQVNRQMLPHLRKRFRCSVQQRNRRLSEHSLRAAHEPSDDRRGIGIGK